MRDFDDLLAQAKAKPPDEGAMLALLEGAAAGPEHRQALWNAAYETRQANIGDEFVFEGALNSVLPCRLAPFCLFCPYWRSDGGRDLALDEVVAGAQAIQAAGIDAMHISGGTQPGSDGEEILEVVGAIHDAGALQGYVNVNCGPSMNGAALDQLKAWGVSSVSSVFETTDPAVFDAVKPGEDLDEKLAFAREVEAHGLDLGSGLMAGLGPAEGRLARYAKDLALLQTFSRLRILYITKFLPEPSTPMANEPRCSFDEAMNLLAVARLALPHTSLRAAAGWARDEALKSVEAGSGPLWCAYSVSPRGEYYKKIRDTDKPAVQAEGEAVAEDVEIRDTREAVAQALSPYGIRFGSACKALRPL